MPVYSKTPNGGVNSDLSDFRLNSNATRYTLNLRTGVGSNTGLGTLQNIKGNLNIPFTLPSGNSKCIGTCVTEVTNKVYLFIQNDLHFDSIYEFDYQAQTVTLVFQNISQTAGVDITKWNVNNRINHVNCIHGDNLVAGVDQKLLLYWTDGINAPRKININRFKSGFYGTTTNESEITAIKRQPQFPMSVSVLNDATKTTNNIVGKLFQFKYRFLYLDGEKSAWSASSYLAVPNSSKTSNSPTLQNYINLIYQINTVDRDCNKIEIAGSIKSDNNKDYFSIVTVDNTPSTVGGVSNSLNFYNDGQYSALDINESILSFDYLPQLAQTQEVVNGNVLVYGNTTDGYPNVSVTGSTINDYYLPIATPPSNVNGVVHQGFGASEIDYTGVVEIGDQFQIIIRQSATDYTVGNYTAIAGDTLTSVTLALYNQLVAQAPPPSIMSETRVIYSPTSIKIGFAHAFGATITSVITQSGGVVDSSIVYKQNSIYQFGYVYYDEFGRSGAVNTDVNQVVHTEPEGVNYFQQGYAPLIQLVTNHLPPVWAKTYQIVRTKNLTHEMWLDWVAKPVRTVVGSKVYTDFSILTVDTFDAISSSSVLNYSFVKGDRLRIRGRADQPLGNNATTAMDFVVVGVVEAFDTGGHLTKRDVRVEFDANTIPLGFAGNGMYTWHAVFEVYRPKTTFSQADQNVFYEIGESYPIVNGFHVGKDQTQTSVLPAVTKLTRGDCYLKRRVIPIAGATLPPAVPYSDVTYDDVIIEEPNFSDYYSSAVYDDGKANVIDANANTIKHPTTIVYSQPFAPQSNINGLNRFFPLNFEEYDRNKGEIKKLALRENYLILYQRLQTGNVPVLRALIENLSSAGQVGLSQELLAKTATYYDFDNCGIGDAVSSFARFDNNFYHVNPNNGTVFRLSAGGMDAISNEYGMNYYFSNKLRSYIGTDKVIGYVDVDKDEYIMTFEASGSEAEETIAFNEGSKIFSSFYSFIPDNGFNAGNDLYTVENGRLWIHEENTLRNNFYGVQYPSIVEPVWNDNPLLTKTFISLALQSNGNWSVDPITTELGQLSNLLETDFYVEDLGGGVIMKDKENVRYASFLRDINSDGGILDGASLKGVWLKARLINNSSDLVYLFTADVKAVQSPQGIMR